MEWLHSVVVSTSALHTESPGFEPQVKPWSIPWAPTTGCSPRAGGRRALPSDIQSLRGDPISLGQGWKGVEAELKR